MTLSTQLQNRPFNVDVIITIITAKDELLKLISLASSWLHKLPMSLVSQFNSLYFSFDYSSDPWTIYYATFSAFKFDFTEFPVLLTSYFLVFLVLSGFSHGKACQNPQVLVALYLIHKSRSPSLCKFIRSLLTVLFSLFLLRNSTTLSILSIYMRFSHLLSRHAIMILISTLSQTKK